MQAEHEDVVIAVLCCIGFKPPPPGVMQEHILDGVKSKKRLCTLSGTAVNCLLLQKIT